MNRTHPLSQFMPYGAPELLTNAPQRLAGSFTAGSALTSAAFLLALAIGPSWIRTEPLHPDVVIVTQSHDIVDTMIPPVEPSHGSRGSEGSGVGSKVESRRADLGQITPTESDLPEWSDPGSSDPAGPIGIGDPDVGGIAASSRDEFPERGAPIAVDEPPVSVKEVIPPYPADMRDAGIEGLVVVHALVGKDGRVVRAEADSRLTVPGLEDAAVEATRRWVFVPATVQGRPIAMWVTIPFHFRLHEVWR